MDLITHLPCISASYDSVCTIIDHLSKYTYSVLYIEAISTEYLFWFFLCTIIARHGMPHRINSDYEPRFASRYWSALVSGLGCEHAKSLSHHPEIDRKSERIHKSLN